MAYDDFSTRMKMYESYETGRFMPGLPIVVRLDGKGFSKFTRGMQRPFDTRMQACMIETTKFLVGETNAKIGYTQSDEITLVLHTDSPDSQVWFDGKKQKIVSVLASMCSVKFNRWYSCKFPDNRASEAYFDCRAWTVPSKTEAANAVLWREQDATKNAVSMAARHYFSHKDLQGKSGNVMQEMMWSEHGVNFNDYPAAFRRGTFLQRKSVLLPPPEDHAALARQEAVAGPVLRHRIVALEMPKFSTVTNRTDVIFDSAAPEVLSNE